MRQTKTIFHFLMYIFAASAAAFVPTQRRHTSSIISWTPAANPRLRTFPPSQVGPLVVLSAKAKASKTKPKGFGTPKDEAATIQSTTMDSSSPPSSSSSSTASVTPPAATTKREVVAPTTLNAGQQALAEMRRQKAEEKDAELRRVRDMLDADRQVKESTATIPEKVSQRMLGRMLPFVGLPFFLGLGSFVMFWYLATYKNLELEPALVAASTIAILVSGLLGITYSVMSASWDPEREGSFWGWSEFTRNIGNIQEGLGRSRENAVLRDKMTGLSENELQTALADLERREAAEAKKQQSLQSKLKDEMES